MMTFRSKMLAVAILLLSPKSLPAQEQAVKADTIRHSEHYTDDRGREFVRFWYEPLAMDARFVPEMRVEKEGEGKRLTVRSGSYSIDATKSAGSISYSESVSPGGAQILSVPIETVPVPSILPQMALVYNSQSGNGLAGYGWGLSGLSAITVTSKSIYYDGTAAPVDLDSPSTLSFSLDGVRLVPNTTPGMTDYQYVTAQGFIYVKKVTVDSGAGAGNIRYFEALYPNGNRAVFGYTSNQLTKWNYPLTSITDHRGYRIDIDYMADGGVYYVQSVGYGGRTTGTHPAYLHFTYQSRSDKVTAYLSSSPICQGKILTGITSYNSGTAVRSYSLTHELQYGFNGDIWKNLEDGVRNVVKGKADTVYVVTGAAFRKVGGSETINTITSVRDNKILPVPNYYWKVLLKVKWTGGSVSGAKAIGFWLNHWETYSTAGNAYEACAVSVDQIEQWTGFDFFSNLSTSLQSGAEAATDWAAFKAY